MTRSATAYWVNKYNAEVALLVAQQAATLAEHNARYVNNAGTGALWSAQDAADVAAAASAASAAAAALAAMTTNYNNEVAAYNAMLADRNAQAAALAAEVTAYNASQAALAASNAMLPPTSPITQQVGLSYGGGPNNTPSITGSMTISSPQGHYVVIASLVSPGNGSQTNSMSIGQLYVNGGGQGQQNCNASQANGQPSAQWAIWEGDVIGTYTFDYRMWTAGSSSSPSYNGTLKAYFMPTQAHSH